MTPKLVIMQTRFFQPKNPSQLCAKKSFLLITSNSLPNYLFNLLTN